MRTAHSAAREASSGPSQRAKNGAAKSDATRQEPVELGEREAGEDHAGLVGEQAGERLVGAQAGGCLDHAGHEDVFEVVGLAHGHRQRGEEPGHLGLDDAGKDGVLPAGEGPIQRGPRDTRFSRDVVRGRLLQALGTDAAQRRIDDPHPLGAAVVAAETDHPGDGGLVAPSGRAPSIRRREAATDATLWHDLSQCQRPAGFSEPGPARSPPAARRARGGPAGRGRRGPSDPGT